MAQSANALVLDMTGTHPQGAVVRGSYAAPGDTALTFTQNGSSVSASFATGTPIPEPATIVIMGIGLCGAALLRCFAASYAMSDSNAAIISRGNGCAPAFVAEFHSAYRSLLLTAAVVCELL